MTLAQLRERGGVGQDTMRGIEQGHNNSFPGATTMRPVTTK